MVPAEMRQQPHASFTQIEPGQFRQKPTPAPHTSAAAKERGRRAGPVEQESE